MIGYDCISDNKDWGKVILCFEAEKLDIFQFHMHQA